MTQSTLIFDETALRVDLLDAMATTPVSLSTKAPRGSGIYAIFHTGTHPLYPPSATRPVYVGSALSLRKRLPSHRLSLKDAKDINVVDFEVIIVSTDTFGLALLAESTLIDVHQPVWNTLAGFGSKAQGILRASGQQPSPWDRLHPGRRWTNTPNAKPCPILQEWVRDYTSE